MKYIAIKTKEFGFISGRDAIFLDEFQQNYDKCIFKGEFNNRLIEISQKNKEYIPYMIEFHDVIFYQCYKLDFYENEPKMASSFDIVENSDIVQKLKTYRNSSKITGAHKHYVFQTYDYVYDIVAENYYLKVI